MPDEKPPVASAPPEAPPAGPSPEAQASEAVDLTLPQPVLLSFWQQPWVQNILPFATSLVLHATLIIVGILGYKAATTVIAVVREQIIIPDAQIVEGAEVGGIPNPGLGGDPNRAAAQDQVQDVPPDQGWSDKKSDSFSNAMMGGGSSDSSDSVIGVGTGGGFGKGAGVGSGSGDGGGNIAPFGVPGGGGGLGPKSPFLGVSGNATRVIYLCDASGTMMDKFDLLRDQLRRAVSVLKPIQSFNIIFFHDDVVDAFSPKGLTRATADTQSKSYDWVDKSYPRGTTNPIPAIEAAFAQKPQLIYVLTDGFDAVADYQQVIDTFRKLNKNREVKVNTILILTRQDDELMRVLKTIATENGGIFKVVKDEDWQR